MGQSIDDLTMILEKELQLHEVLVQTAGCINQTIKSNDIDGLKQHTTRYDEQYCQLEQVEVKRVECCSSIIKEFGLPPQTVHLSTILTKSPLRAKTKLEQIQAALKQKIMELSKVNTSNRILIEHSLGSIENAFMLLRNASKRVTGYCFTGNCAYSPSNRSLINQVI